MSQSDFLCAKEVAQLLGTSLKWVYAHQDEIPGRIKIAGLIRWDENELLNELKKQASQRPKHHRPASQRGRRRNDKHNLLAA